VDDVEGDEDDLDVPDLVARSPSSLDDSDSDEEDDDQPPRKPPWPPPQQVPSTYATSSLTTHRHTTIAAYKSTTYTTRAELDSHANTCSFGKNAYIVQDTGQTISVTGFISSLGTVKRVPIVTAAIAYDDPATYQTYILFFHQSLYFEKLDKHLLCPAQMRANQIIVNEVPLLHLPVDQRTPTAHSIITEPPHIDLHIPLFLSGTTSYFETRLPTANEIASDDDCIHIHMTSDHTWDPYDESVGHS
jgi:hypothetical protein